MPKRKYDSTARNANRERVREAAGSIAAREGRLPTLAELGEATGLSQSTVSVHRRALVAAGRIGGADARRKAVEAKVEQVRQAGEAIHARTGRPPTRGELAEAVGISVWAVIRHRARLIGEGRWPYGVLEQGRRTGDPPHIAGAREANREKVRAAADVVFARTGHSPTLVELAEETGLSRATVSGHRKALIEAGRWPFEMSEAWRQRCLRRAAVSRPSEPDPDLDGIDAGDVWARARKLRELRDYRRETA